MTARVHLVPCTQAHLPGMVEMWADADSRRFTRVPEPPPPDFPQTWLRGYEVGRRDGTREAFAVLDEDDTFCGVALAPAIDPAARTAELGYVVHPSARGRGVGTQALGLLTDWGFGTLDALRLELLISVENAASKGVARRNGYTYEGTLRSIHVKQEVWKDCEMWSRLAREAGVAPQIRRAGSLSIERLGREAWRDAMRLCARAMADQPYAFALFGDDPIARLAGTARDFMALPWDPGALVMGARVAGEVVGVARLSEARACSICAQARPATDFDAAVRTQHASQPPHARVGPVAVEPTLQGAGVGSLLMTELLAAFGDEGRILLECVPATRPFYERFGFGPVRSFRDPAGPELTLMAFERAR